MGAQALIGGETAGISGKVKAGSLAAVAAGALSTTLMEIIHPWLVGHGVSDGSAAALQTVVVASLTGLFTFVAAYLARHTPAGVKSEAEELLAEIVENPELLVAAKGGELGTRVGTVTTPVYAGEPVVVENGAIVPATTATTEVVSPGPTEFTTPAP